ncbi:alpha/beta fold hydrolase [Legionella dresdenensis]|uniref:Alpha/beta fold hydrolase n=1 Tax=Legionella dresdenensis TaxID=450200 RepID=A0ABV8CFP3_9GAMM
MSNYNKQVLKHPDFYLVAFIKDLARPGILFIHGGPGFHCGILEYLIEHHKLFETFNYNIILYDQRNCGRSKKTSDLVLHQDNVTDLEEIISFITYTCNLQIGILVGHSYGAKLLYDSYKKFSPQIPGVFLSTSRTILTPRLNNLMLDLTYLKKNHPNAYERIYDKLEEFDLDKLWEITEDLAPLFQKNSERDFFYWSNLKYYNIVKDVQKKINLPINNNVFMNVRKELYSNISNFPVEIDKLGIPKLWINGFHDFIMNGHQSSEELNSKIITFYKSSHYPHIEENLYFCEVLNKFIQDNFYNEVAPIIEPPSIP